MVRRCLTLAVIVSGLSGCDNVAWGGAEVRLTPPPPVEGDSTRARGGDGDTDPDLPPLPEGPLLLTGTRDGADATLTVVGEIRGDAVLPIPAERDAPGYTEYLTRNRLSPGTEFFLFSRGVRVGRMSAGRSGVDDRFCQPRPTVSGIVEMVPTASEAVRFLAVPAQQAGAIGFGEYNVLSDDFDQRSASIEIIQDAIRENGATWPSALVPARADIRSLALAGVPGNSFVATFLYEDQLRAAQPSRNGWSMFMLGVPTNGGYERAFTLYRPVDPQGKGAPRLVDHFDWDNDGVGEMLLDVYGSSSQWFATVDRRGGEWSVSFQDSCGQPAPAAADTTSG